MEDKRIRRTKKAIKTAFVELLEKMSFEKMTVAEICRVAEVSRITYYTYYESKYALVDEYFQDKLAEATETYYALQEKENPEDDTLIGYKNLMECIITLFYDNRVLFDHMTAKENPYLFSHFYEILFGNVVDYLNRHPALNCKYSPKVTAGFALNGFLGIINVCSEEHMQKEEVRQLTRSLYTDVFLSNLFLN